jgi:hypothetical protein
MAGPRSGTAVCDVASAKGWDRDPAGKLLVVAAVGMW